MFGWVLNTSLNWYSKLNNYYTPSLMTTNMYSKFLKCLQLMNRGGALIPLERTWQTKWKPVGIHRYYYVTKTVGNKGSNVEEIWWAWWQGARIAQYCSNLAKKITSSQEPFCEFREIFRKASGLILLYLVSRLEFKIEGLCKN